MHGRYSSCLAGIWYIAMSFLNRVLALTIALTVSAAGITVVGSNAPEVDVIVTLEQTEAASSGELAIKYADAFERRFPQVEVGFVYDTLLCGFHAKIPENMIGMVEQLDYVEDVFLCGKYEMLETEESYGVIENSFDMIGYTDELGEKLSGDGIKVAVIDSGFDVSHPAFSGKGITNTLDLDEVNNSKFPDRIQALRAVEDAHELYVNEKIPFCFDYAENDKDVKASSNHGTHVAGIIGATPNEISSMNGIAEGCQLLLMKVFDSDGYTRDHILVAAMEDALKLGADVVNLSLGSYSGSANQSQLSGIDDILQKMESAGCMVICAVGNDAIATGEQENGDYSTLPPASYTDFGTVSTPSASDYSLAVTSVDNRYNLSQFILHKPSGAKIEYSDTNIDYDVLDIRFAEHFNGQTLEYVPIPGIGSSSDYDGIDVNGKLALVERGTITFVEKADIAASKGAVGLIVYNNVEGAIGLELTGAKIPAISISQSDGLMLTSAVKAELTFDTANNIRRENPTVGKISSFASRGATPSLTLKPDIAAIGDQILSAINGGNYGVNSGTSMAAPQLSGMCALMLEKLGSDGITENKAELVRRALMNTAKPIIQENGVECSPRTQGAGLASISLAVSSELELTYAPTGKPKAELFDFEGDSVTLELQIKNITDNELNISLGATISTDGYLEAEISGKTTYFNSLEAVSDTTSAITAFDGGNLNRNAHDFAPLSIALSAGESVTVPLNFKFDMSYHNKLDEIFTNGHFVDGYIYCETDKGSYSLPYMGYMGDWGAAPAIDANYYTDEYNVFGGTAFISEADMNMVILEAPDKDADIAFSPNGDGIGDSLLFGIKPIRNIKASSFVVSDTDGSEIFSYDHGYITKYYIKGIYVYPPFTWTGNDRYNKRYYMEDGIYTVKYSFTLDAKDEPTQSYEYRIRIDTEKPTLNALSLDGELLTVSASDVSEIKTIYICENALEGAYYQMAVETDTATFDISDYSGDVLYYEIIDHALNTLVGKINLSKIRA